MLIIIIFPLAPLAMCVFITSLIFKTNASINLSQIIITLIRSLKNLRVLTIENAFIPDHNRIKEMLVKMPSSDLKGLKQVVIRSKSPRMPLPFSTSNLDIDNANRHHSNL